MKFPIFRMLLPIAAITVIGTPDLFARSDRAPIRSCKDWNVTIHDERPAITAEKFDIRNSGTDPFGVEASPDGGVSLSESTDGTFSITLCRAAIRRLGPDAVKSIRLERQPSSVKVIGPHGGGWASLLIVRAPRNASVKLSADNGPLAIVDFQGTVVARSRNGPIDVKRVGGTITVDTTNGPIAFQGGSGNVTLRAENGPLQVSLDGADWKGKGLVGSTTNGPLSVSIGKGFGSAVEVRSSSDSPWNCPDTVCNRSSFSRGEGTKMFRRGSSNSVVRLRTDNGPVGIR